MVNLALFATGSGSNAEAIISYFKDHPHVRVSCIISNKPDAYVLQRAKNHSIDARVFQKSEFENGNVLEYLNEKKVDMIALAGFLLLVPESLIASFPILNIHPALLPKFGGKGMYGMNVHKAVAEAGESESGMTIHVVDQNYDEGKILFQESCPVYTTDTPETIAARVLKLEHKNYPRVIEEFAKKAYNF